MFDKSIDVSKIMQDIKKQSNFIESGKNEVDDKFSANLNKNEIIDIDVNKFNEITSNLENKKVHLSNLEELVVKYINIGTQIPNLKRFVFPIRKILVFVAKLVLRVSQIFTRDQREVNNKFNAMLVELTKCIDLLESKQKLLIEEHINFKSQIMLELNNVYERIKEVSGVVSEKISDVSDNVSELENLIDSNDNNDENERLFDRIDEKLTEVEDDLNERKRINDELINQIMEISKTNDMFAQKILELNNKNEILEVQFSDALIKNSLYENKIMEISESQSNSFSRIEDKINEFGIEISKQVVDTSKLNEEFAKEIVALSKRNEELERQLANIISKTDLYDIKINEVGEASLNSIEEKFRSSDEYMKVTADLSEKSEEILKEITELSKKNEEFVKESSEISKKNDDLEKRLEEIIIKQDSFEKKFGIISDGYLASNKGFTDVNYKINKLESRLFKIIKKITYDNNDGITYAMQNNILDDIKKTIDDESYLEFENRFRGSREDIKSRLEFYIDYVKPSLPNSECRVLDIGCGRGEWLELLNELGFNNALGIDINKSMITICKEYKINAIVSDAISYLDSLEDESVSVITAFQVVEHINNTDLNILIREMNRVLKSDGVVILETPNPQNLIVSSFSFNIDPSHVKPLHPELLSFCLEANGFINNKIVYWQKEMHDKWWNEMELLDSSNINSTRLNAIVNIFKEYFNASADYAIVGRKM